MDLPRWILTDDILFFNKSKGIKLLNKSYIHNNRFMFWSDPYTCYWYYKIKNEILLNCRSIVEIREDKLKELGIK